LSTSKVKKNSLFASAGVVSGCTALSRILGLVREQTVGYFFGASMVTDAFVAAYRIPNLLRDMFAEGALSSAFVPIFKEKLVNEGDSEAFSLARTIATAILAVVGGIVLLGIVATPVIVFATANGFTADPVKFDLTVNMTRLMFVYLLLVSLSALVMGMLNSFGRFGIPAISPALFNLGVILSIVALHRFLEVPIYALAIGVLVGGVGQLVIQLPLLLKIGFRFRPQFRFLDQSVKRVVRLFVPMVVGMSAGRVNILVNTLLASFLMEGSLSYLNFSYRLMHFPLGVFAVALGTVALPRASESAAKGDLEGVGKTFSETFSYNMFLVLPSAAFLALAGHDMVELIYQWGAFTRTATDNTYLALLHYSYGLVGFAAVRVIVPIYYALEDSKLPMRISLITVAVNIGLYYPMIRILDFAGLASATSIAALLNSVLLLGFLSRKGVPVRLGSISLGFFRMILAASLAVFTAKLLPIDIAAGSSEVIRRVFNFSVLMISTGLLYLLFCFFFRVREISLLLRLFGRRNRNE